MDSSQSYDNAPHSTSRIHRQRSNHGLRAASHGQPFPMSSAPQDLPVRSSGGFGEGVKARKGSIRSAVRKIFGRRSRDSISHGPIDADPPQTASRHAYHKSEPPVPMPSQPEVPEPHEYDSSASHAFAPAYPASRPSFSRTTSPYALQFPNSVRLKPMDLGHQFSSPPQPLRRRKTLPNMLPEEQDHVNDEHVTKETSEEPMPPPDRVGDATAAKSIAELIKRDRRKSRSTDDLQATAAREHSVPRKRSEEIRYWRESFQPDALRSSGFATQPSSRGQISAARPSMSRGSERRDVQTPPTPPREVESHSKPATMKSSPPRYRGGPTSLHGDSQRPSSAVDTEMSKDLEDRVAKLEAGLQNFQRSLQKLTADRNRRTIVMSGGLTNRGSSGDMRTPSMLAETLADPLEPSNYEYEYGHTMRPVTSAQPPLAASVHDDSETETHEVNHPKSHRGPLNSHAPTPPRSAELRPEPERAATPQTSSATMAAVTPGTMESSGGAHPPEWTFRSLYQMLSDERSARRKLETQLKGLRQEISELHSQVNSTSTLQSTRSSYMLAGSSSRLQDLLRETGEGSPPSASPRSLKRQSGFSAHSTGGAGPVVSRFSGSDSEALTQEFAHESDELETPNDAYRTPLEERSKWSIASKDNEMF
ncbi:hypothetical protein CB0940_00797 [Cercospora beticola]|uniref:Uncharacterized protein n=1 Tax=Cercospora beticola TaxID=122368 RepID=A0A2G5IA09_CERBT|nr:hypothetical protein CB0940_00797 [Cercospora beticola]PIB01374.1 hypothetical protein CB0940_00797 [Cercospora beticola]WPA96225.1 hypothetical protein RHO25_000831 [Cercospora beticola]CAK1355484.1 unnamed protein product [Cercospora beticola]